MAPPRSKTEQVASIAPWIDCRSLRFSSNALIGAAMPLPRDAPRRRPLAKASSEPVSLVNGRGPSEAARSWGVRKDARLSTGYGALDKAHSLGKQSSARGQRLGLRGNWGPRRAAAPELDRVSLP